MNTVSFPGLGIGEITLNRVAFSIGTFQIYWYGVIIGIGFVLALLFALWRAKQIGYNSDVLVDLVIFATPVSIICARAYYVIMELDRYDSFGQMIRIWDGGLAIYGGVIGAILTALVYAKVRRVNLFELLDFAGPSFLLGQAIGRWGNFMNVEAYGTATDLPWRMKIPGGMEVHPCFLYESLWNLLGFALLFFYFNKRKFKGEVFFLYMAWYGLGRFFIEGLRTDSLYVGNIRISQLLAAVFFISSLAVIITVRVRMRRQQATEEVYQSVFGAVRDEDEADALEEETLTAGGAAAAEDTPVEEALAEDTPAEDAPAPEAGETNH